MAMNESSSGGWTSELAASLVSFSLLALVAVPANSLLISAFVYNRRLRSITNTLVIGLAGADLLIGLLSLPWWMQILVKFYHNEPRDYTSYQFYITLDIFLGSAAIFLLASISLERWHAIARPLVHRLISRKKVVGVLTAAWAAAGIIATLQPMQYRTWEPVYTTIVTTACFVAPLLVIAVAYWQVLVITRRSRGMQRHALQARLAREVRLSLTLVIITVLFVCSWLPLFVLTLLATFAPSSYPESFALLMFAKWMHYSSSAVNPFLYAFRNDDVKITIRVMLCRGFFRKGPTLRELSVVARSRSVSVCVASRRSSSSTSSIKRPSVASSSSARTSSSSDGNID